MSTPYIERVRAAADFAGIVCRYTRLKRSGRQLLGLCPFHSERHPSFYVDPARQLWKCFGCERGGDVFSFVQALCGCDFRGAIRQVARVVAGKPLSLPQMRVRACIGARGAGDRRSPQTAVQREEIESLRRRLALRYVESLIAGEAELPPCMRADLLLVRNRITLHE